MTVLRNSRLFVIAILAGAMIACSGASFAGPGGGDVTKVPGDKMHQLPAGMLRTPNLSPYVGFKLVTVWLQDVHGKQTQASGNVLSGAQICPVALAYRAILMSSVANPTVALVLSDGTVTPATAMGGPAKPSGAEFYTLYFGGTLDVSDKLDATNFKNNGPLKSFSAHVQIQSPVQGSSQTYAISGAGCSNLVCSIDGCGYQ